MKKRLIALILALTMVCALLACCGGKDNTPGDTQQPAGDQQTNEPAGDTQQPADPAPADPAPADIDYKTFTIDPAQIPQEKLDTTLYLAVSIRGLENPYIATINDGMHLFAKYLDSIGQKYEMQVLDSQGDSAKEVDNMRQFSAKANGNAIAYSDPNEDAIA